MSIQQDIEDFEDEDTGLDSYDYDWGCGDPYCHICGDSSWMDDDEEN